MSVYLIARITIHDREEYGKYEAGFMEVFAKYSGTILAVDENPKVVEGEWDATRTVLVEFPSHEEADAWYQSDGYQAIVQHRFAAATSDIIRVTGMEGG